MVYLCTVSLTADEATRVQLHEHVYEYARGQYNTSLLGVSVQTPMAQTSTQFRPGRGTKN